MDPARFVFLDETATTTAITKRYGRSPSDQRLVAAVPHGHWRTTTLIAGLGQTGIIAPLVLDGPMTGVACHAYVEQFLTPARARRRRGARQPRRAQGRRRPPGDRRGRGLYLPRAKRR
jgi:hypothetical protein